MIVLNQFTRLVRIFCARHHLQRGVAINQLG
ncbi:Uncharacterised protein [Vibrio cholerae]|nr:Uncharacterised protein [Vibrio cholerae]